MMVSGPNLNETSIVSGGYGGTAEGIIPTSSIKGRVLLHSLFPLLICDVFFRLRTVSDYPQDHAAINLLLPTVCALKGSACCLLISVGGLIPGCFILHAKVSLGKILNPSVNLCEC